MKGAIVGLDLASPFQVMGQEMNAVYGVYLAHIQAFALETRLIIERLQQKGHNIESIYLCGGLQHNELFTQIHADVLGKAIVVPACTETVALGSAILGAYASGEFSRHIL